MAKKQTKTEKRMEKTDVVETPLQAVKKIGTRGKVFQGTVIKKFPKRVVIEFERMVYVRKYERYTKTKTKIHARLPESMEKTINVGDLIKIQECRPLSKIIHFIVIEKIKDTEDMDNKGGEK